jgi:hypothetical protein
LFENVAKLGAVQLGVGRHRGEAGVPDRIEHFDIVRAVLRSDRDAVTRLETHSLQCTGEARDTRGNFAVASQHPRAKTERRAFAVLPPRMFEIEREIHLRTNLSPSS